MDLFNNKSISNELFISKDKYDSIKNKYGVPQKGDILLNAIGNYLGTPFIVNNAEFYFKDGNIVWFKNFDSKLNNIFLFWWFQSPIAKHQMLTKSIGSAQKALTIKALESFEIELPNIQNQYKIVRILGNIDDKIKTVNNININLTKLSSIIFINLMEKSNNFLELNRCCKFIKGKKPKETSDYPQSNFLDYLTIDVLSNQSQMYAYDEKGILANEYDILMVMDGASSGKLFYGKSGLVGSTLAKLNVEEKYLEIVYQFLKQSEKFISDNTTGSAIPHTDKGLVLSLKCPISEELLNYSDTFKSIRSSIITNNNEILKLQKLRDTLLPKLMSGEIDVSKINCDMLQICSCQ